MTPSERLEMALRNVAPQTPAALLSTLRVSQPTLSRAITVLGERVARMGNARATQYALVRDIGRDGHRWPLHRIDAAGRAHTLGTLIALQAGRWVFEASSPLRLPLEGTSERGVFAGLPWFLADCRPQGFMGRAFARQYGAALGAPLNPTHWTDDDVIVSMLHLGHDLPGDLALGDRSLAVALDAKVRAPDAIAARQRAKHYSAWAIRALEGDVVGSSAGGEQPKFGASVAERNGAVREVLVKFTERAVTPSARRWSDLLVCEHLAGETLRAITRDPTRSEILQFEGRTFLEVSRFDRVDTHGRRGFVSLGAVESALSGRLDRWIDAADRLEHGGWLTKVDAEALRIRWFFGTLIGNTDMHFGNAAMVLAPSCPLPLAPSYDMLPMMDRPSATGEIVDRGLTVTAPAPSAESAWKLGAGLAIEFWSRVGTDLRISAAYRRIAKTRRRTIEATRTRLGI